MRLLRSHFDIPHHISKGVWNAVTGEGWMFLQMHLRTAVEEIVDDQVWVQIFDDITETIH